MSFLKFLDKKFELMLLGLMLAVFTVLMFTNVVLRYTMGTSIVWGDELCRYCLVASTFLSIPIWIRRRTGIRVDAVLSLLPKSVHKFMDFAVYVLLLVFFGYLFMQAVGVYQNMAKFTQVSAAMHMPTKYLYAMAAAGFGLAMFRTVEVLIEMIFELFSPAEGGAE